MKVLFSLTREALLPWPFIAMGLIALGLALSACSLGRSEAELRDLLRRHEAGDARALPCCSAGPFHEPALIHKRIERRLTRDPK